MRFMTTLLQAIIGCGIVVLLWWLAGAAGVASHMLPGPLAVANKVLELLGTEAFRRHVWASLTVLAYGLAPALLAGVLIGAVAGASAAGRWLFGSLALVLAATPLVALIPLLVLWLGLTIAAKSTLVFLAAAFPIANAIMVRWPAHDEEAKMAAEHTGSRTAAIVAGLRLGVMIGISTLMVAELLASNSGIGFFLMMSSATFNTAEVIAALLIVFVPAIAVGAILQAIEAQLT